MFSSGRVENKSKNESDTHTHHNRGTPLLSRMQAQENPACLLDNAD